MPACPNHPAEYDLRPCARCGRSFCANCVVQLQGAYYCVDCKAEQVRDALSGTRASLDLASIGRRFVAQFIDWMVQTGVIMIFVVPFIAVLFGVGAASGWDFKKDPPPLSLIHI